MDGIANQGDWPYDFISKVPSGLHVLFRDTFISNMISFKAIDAQKFVKKNNRNVWWE
jgi:hypothetical protein